MWSSGETIVFHCPESELDGEALYWLDLAEMARSGIAVKSLDMVALDYEAITVIENEWRKVNVNGTK